MQALRARNTSLAESLLKASGSSVSTKEDSAGRKEHGEDAGAEAATRAAGPPPLGSGEAMAAAEVFGPLMGSTAQIRGGWVSAACRPPQRGRMSVAAWKRAAVEAGREP